MRVLRSMLFVPGNNWRMIERAKKENEDAVILDIEDAVPIGEKETARWFIKDAIPMFSAAFIDTFVRVNSPATGLISDDLHFAVQQDLTGIVLPKSESRADIMRLDRIIRREERTKRIKLGSVAILPLIETARGVLNAQDIAEASKRVVALAFGAADYMRDLGRSYIAMSETEAEILYARSRLALASRVAGVPAVDTPFFGLTIDEKGLVRQAMLAAQLGFKGKLVIHPGHVDPVNQVFTPSKEDVEQSRKIMEAYEEAAKRGLGAASLEGRMIDYATYEMAKEQLSFVEAIENRKEKRG
jgi:citrate lyase subunit beta/citryl-CoA lyase